MKYMSLLVAGGGTEGRRGKHEQQATEGPVRPDRSRPTPRSDVDVDEARDGVPKTRNPHGLETEPLKWRQLCVRHDDGQVHGPHIQSGTRALQQSHRLATGASLQHPTTKEETTEEE